MKKTILSILLIALMIVMCVCLTGCEKKDGGENTQPTNAEVNNNETLDYANITAEDLLSRIANRDSLTKDEYKWLISTYSYATIKDDLTLEKNITDEALSKLDSKAKPSLSEILPDLLKSESPQVRGYAISQITSLLGVSKTNLELAKELIKTETNEYVLVKATRALSNEAKNGKEIAEFLIKMASHENAKIRNEAAIALGNSWSIDVDGAVEAVIKLMNDKDATVRKTACKYSGKLADESVIEPLVKILKNADDADIHGSCVEGLTYLWYDYPFFKNTSEKAYKATMDYLKTTPRTEKVPSWTAVGAFKTTSTQDSFKEWKKKATYFDTDEIYDIMVDIIKDKDAAYLARTSAIDVVKAHCSEKQFKDLKTVIDGLTDSKASTVKSAYETKAK